MKYTLLLMAIGIFTFPAQLLADDFGERFYGEAPAALDQGDQAFTTDALEQAAQEEFRPELIEPAAGEYFDSENQEQSAASQAETTSENQ